ncbi:hypothetical protein GGR57DRAFT_504597 [Xylariaceae sp. FL1272]|nr:hypothetical protein GGR57DRAFT_504597 [Xylariaceae sp. FL1272]
MIFTCFLTLLITSTSVLSAALPDTSPATPTATCTTGTPITTAGYPISYYVQATPKATSFANGYRPEPTWASQHLVATYTFGVPPPIETGFAYAQFKCQFYCENFSKGGSFFVRYASEVGSYCNCFNEL